ncbi:MAG: hypothetical protein JSS75_00965 [Bacteroidetes bacterium]|nr:hypothetical protein [Bacteroidota bacterium]
MRIRYKLSLGVLLLCSGCSSTDITSADQIVFPATNVSYKAHVAPLLAIACNAAGCHDMARPENANVDLTSWISLRGSTNVVNQPGDTNCGLVKVVYARVGHPGPLRINDNHRQGIKQWVIEGAQNN